MQIYIPAPDKPRETQRSFFSNFDIQIDALLGAPHARDAFKVDGAGLTVAVLDTGLRTSHVCFKEKVLEGHNFTEVGSEDDVTDTNGHGTNVSGLIVARSNDERRGIAPGANVVPLKVIPAPSVTPITRALQWAERNSKRLNITVINMSLGVPGLNLTDDLQAREEHPELHAVICDLYSKNIPICVAAGNDYHRFQTEGMSVPAIFREVISVGAVYDSSVGDRLYISGAAAHMTHADQITPFSQRLSVDTSPECYTDIFSAGGGATSAGAQDDDGTSTQDGTSQAAPTIAGIILLLQQHYLRLKGELPPISLLQDVLRATSTWLLDDESRQNDNVTNTGKIFPRANAFESLVALDRHIKMVL
jgi:subtilisin family serine protease